MTASSLAFNPDENVLPEDFFKRVHGFLSLREAHYLYWLASRVPSYGRILEIGAYQGRSTIALALGARKAMATVWSVDHHPVYDDGGTRFNPQDLQAYYENISAYGIGDIVRTINLPSEQAILCWIDAIDLLWIDGRHEYDRARYDWYLWSWHTNLVAMHDTAGHHAGITLLVHEILETGQWKADETVDAITVFSRIKGAK